MIVVVAESGFLRASIRVNLVPAGYRILEIEPASLLDVLGQLRDLQPGLVLLDLDIENWSGETLVRAMREDPYLHATPLVVITGQGEAVAVERLSRWGLTEYLLKPFHAEALVGIVNALFPPRPREKDQDRAM